MSNLKTRCTSPTPRARATSATWRSSAWACKDVRYPLQLRVGGAEQPTVALWDLDVALPAEQKGTHMSRFVAWLDALDASRSTPPTLRTQMAAMLDKLHAERGPHRGRFPFFLRKRAPVSGVESLLDYQGRWIAETRAGAARRCGPRWWCR